MVEALVADRPTSVGQALVDVVIPVYNEESDLEPNLRRLRDYLDRRFPFPTVITVVDNASTDGTWAVAQFLECELPGVRAMRLDEKGKGRAVRAAWSASNADVVAYMDADLSTDLDALLPLVAPLLSGHSDLAVGTRLARGARVVRGPKRELISRSYNLLLRTALRNGVSDAQCGFKAIRKETATKLLPLVDDDHWFFDTELLVVAQRHRLRIHEVPVDWVDDPDSRVDIARAAIGDLRGVWRLMRGLSEGRVYAGPPSIRPRNEDLGELARFARVGAVSTLVYLTLFAGLLAMLPPYAADSLALWLCVAGNTLAHAKYTLRPAHKVPWRHAIEGALVVFFVTGLTSSAAIWAAGLLGSTSTLALTVAVLIAAVVAAAIRFIVVHAWTFRLHLRASAA